MCTSSALSVTLSSVSTVSTYTGQHKFNTDFILTQYFYTDRFQGGTSVVVPYCSCYLCLYFGSTIMLVTCFVNFR